MYQCSKERNGNIMHKEKLSIQENPERGMIAYQGTETGLEPNPILLTEKAFLDAVRKITRP